MKGISRPLRPESSPDRGLAWGLLLFGFGLRGRLTLTKWLVKHPLITAAQQLRVDVSTKLTQGRKRDRQVRVLTSLERSRVIVTTGLPIHSFHLETYVVSLH